MEAVRGLEGGILPAVWTLGDLFLVKFKDTEPVERTSVPH